MKTNQSVRFLKGVLAGMLTAVLALACVSAKAAHELIYAVDVNNNLVKFYSDTPGTIFEAHAINGLQLNEEIRGLDSWEGILYGLGSSSRLYTIDPNTGAAAQIGAGQFSPLLNGQVFGFDHDGLTGLRVVSPQAQNLVVDQSTGVATAGPTNMYVLGDVNYGKPPVVSGLAYNMYTGQWFAADYGINSLASFNPATGGLSTLGPIGFDVARLNGMDVSPDTGIMYLISAATSSDPQGNLYFFNGTVFQLVGQVGFPGDEVLYRALTVAPEPSSIALLGLGALGLMLARRRQ